MKPRDTLPATLHMSSRASCVRLCVCRRLSLSLALSTLRMAVQVGRSRSCPLTVFFSLTFCVSVSLTFCVRGCGCERSGLEQAARQRCGGVKALRWAGSDGLMPDGFKTPCSPCRSSCSIASSQAPCTNTSHTPSAITRSAFIRIDGMCGNMSGMCACHHPTCQILLPLHLYASAPVFSQMCQRACVAHRDV